MFRSTFVFAATLVCWSGSANAQYEDDSASSPWFGGPGDYAYPVLCVQCTVWQDYRNFAWNQLSINGGDARTPTNPNHVTTFRVYTHTTNDIYPATVEVTLEIKDIKILGETVFHTPADGGHYFVETHPENGDRVPVGFYPKGMGPLQFPYESPEDDDENDDENDDNSGSGRGASSSRGGRGGDSPWGGGYNSGAVGGVFGRGFGRIFGGRGGNFCGPWTNYICIQY